MAFNVNKSAEARRWAKLGEKVVMDFVLVDYVFFDGKHVKILIAKTVVGVKKFGENFKKFASKTSKLFVDSKDFIAKKLSKEKETEE